MQGKVWKVKWPTICELCGKEGKQNIGDKKEETETNCKIVIAYEWIID